MNRVKDWMGGWGDGRFVFLPHTHPPILPYLFTTVVLAEARAPAPTLA